MSYCRFGRTIPAYVRVIIVWAMVGVGAAVEEEEAEPPHLEWTASTESPRRVKEHVLVEPPDVNIESRLKGSIARRKARQLSCPMKIAGRCLN